LDLRSIFLSPLSPTFALRMGEKKAFLVNSQTVFLPAFSPEILSVLMAILGGLMAVLEG
jgi:hypothetical protein